MPSGKTRWLVLALVLLFVVALAAYLFDPDSRLKGLLGGDPWYHGRPATAWHDDLATDDENTRSLTAEQLKDPEAIPVLVHLLKSDGPAEPRWRAADVLGQIGPPARAAGPALVGALNDPDPTVRTVALQAIGKLAPDVPGAVPALVELFPDVEAIRTVARFKAAGAGAVPRLTELLKHPDAAVRWNAGRTLGKIGEPAKSAIPGLVAQLASDPVPLVREHAAEALGDIGPAAASAIPELAKALADPEWKVRRDAVRALGQMGPAAKGVLAKVQALKADPEKGVKEAAGRAERLIDPSLAKGTPGHEPPEEKD